MPTIPVCASPAVPADRSARNFCPGCCQYAKLMGPARSHGTAKTENATRTLNRHHRTALTSSGVLLLVALLAYAWISVVAERNALRVTLVEQGRQLALSLEDTIDVVRGHSPEMQRTVEHTLARPELAGQMPVGKPDSACGKTAGQLWQAVPKSLQPEAGNLHIDPAASLDPARFPRDMSAAMTTVPIASAAHQWNHIFQWSYFYDAGTRWS